VVIDIYKFIGKKDKTYELEEQKMNANCPASEKSGTGPGSCGGGKSANTKDEEEQHKKENPGYLGKNKSGKDVYVAGTSPKSKAIRKELQQENLESMENMKNIVTDPSKIQKISNTLSVVKGKRISYIRNSSNPENTVSTVTFGKLPFRYSYDTREEAEEAAKQFAKTGEIPKRKSD
jgi:hypothetical protein